MNIEKNIFIREIYNSCLSNTLTEDFDRITKDVLVDTDLLIEFIEAVEYYKSFENALFLNESQNSIEYQKISEINQFLNEGKIKNFLNKAYNTAKDKIGSSSIVRRTANSGLVRNIMTHGRNLTRRVANIADVAKGVVGSGTSSSGGIWTKQGRKDLKEKRLARKDRDIDIEVTRNKVAHEAKIKREMQETNKKKLDDAIKKAHLSNDFEAEARLKKEKNRHAYETNSKQQNKADYELIKNMKKTGNGNLKEIKTNMKLDKLNKNAEEQQRKSQARLKKAEDQKRKVQSQLKNIQSDNSQASSNLSGAKENRQTLATQQSNYYNYAKNGFDLKDKPDNKSISNDQIWKKSAETSKNFAQPEKRSKKQSYTDNTPKVSYENNIQTNKPDHKYKLTRKVEYDKNGKKKDRIVAYDAYHRVFKKDPEALDRLANTTYIDKNTLNKKPTENAERTNQAKKVWTINANSLNHNKYDDYQRRSVDKSWKKADLDDTYVDISSTKQSNTENNQKENSSVHEDYQLYTILNFNNLVPNKTNLNLLKEDLNNDNVLLYKTINDNTKFELYNIYNLLEENNCECTDENIFLVKKLISQKKILFY